MAVQYLSMKVQHHTHTSCGDALQQYINLPCNPQLDHILLFSVHTYYIQVNCSLLFLIGTLFMCILYHNALVAASILYANAIELQVHPL